MIKSRILLLVCFLVSFAAGTTAGLVAAKPAPPKHEHSRLMAEFNLTDQQRDQMRKIWSEEMKDLRTRYSEQRKAVAEKRDKDIAAMLTPDQQPKYQQILKDFTRQSGDLWEPLQKQAFDQAVGRTKQMLTPAQVTQYDQWLKKQREKGFGGPRSTHRGPWSRPSTDENRTPRGEE